MEQQLAFGVFNRNCRFRPNRGYSKPLRPTPRPNHPAQGENTDTKRGEREIAVGGGGRHGRIAGGGRRRRCLDHRRGSFWVDGPIASDRMLAALCKYELQRLMLHHLVPADTKEFWRRFHLLIVERLQLPAAVPDAQSVDNNSGTTTSGDRERSVQIEFSYHHLTIAFDNQRAPGADRHLRRDRQHPLEVRPRESEVRRYRKLGTDLHMNPSEFVRLSHTHVATVASKYFRCHVVHVRFSRRWAHSRHSRLNLLNRLLDRVFSRRVADPWCSGGESDNGISRHCLGIILHHTFEPRWLLERNPILVLVLGVHELIHDTTRRLKSLNVALEACHQLVGVARVRAKPGLVSHVALGLAERLQERTQLVVLGVCRDRMAILVDEFSDRADFLLGDPRDAH
mmetsp:Transcript_30055/g.61518  ORF Transcript_30055/g.61518 Transcript_30055/m.61518 type:complete len:397 (+) Transcript_30055:246-1436(+)